MQVLRRSMFLAHLSAPIDSNAKVRYNSHIELSQFRLLEVFVNGISRFGLAKSCEKRHKPL